MELREAFDRSVAEFARAALEAQEREVRHWLTTVAPHDIYQSRGDGGGWLLHTGAGLLLSEVRVKREGLTLRVVVDRFEGPR